MCERYERKIRIMKSHRNSYSKVGAPENHPDTESLRPLERGQSLNTRERRNISRKVISYEEGDLRGIVAKALAGSINPYHALLENGLIKSAAEFFEQDDK
jgi:hypothetical protein